MCIGKTGALAILLQLNQEHMILDRYKKNNQRQIMKLVAAQQRNGFTLLEVVIAMSLFAVLILIVTNVFTKAIEVQKKTIDEQNMQGDIRNAMAIFEDEVQRVTKHADASCNCSAGKFYCVNVNDDTLYVQTKAGKCVSYELASSRLRVTRDGLTDYLTSTDLTLENLEFTPNARGDSVEVRATFKGFADFDQYITYQTMITSTFD
jgi:prepilin-type N-terminal cleavage/methylation domain-containing protein